MQIIRHNQTRRPQRRIARRDRSRHNTQYRQHTPKRTKPLLRQRRSHTRTRIRHPRSLIHNTMLTKERRRSSSPDKSHNTLSHHSTIKHRPPQPRILQATRHQRRLRGMKPAYRTASYRHEHHREYRVLLILSAKTLPHLRQVRPVYEYPRQYPHRHEYQRHRKHRVKTTYDLVYRQHRSRNVIREYHHNPEYRVRPIRRHASKQLRRPRHEHRAHQYHQHYREHTKDRLRPLPQIPTDNLRQRLTIMTQRHHSRDEIMNRTREYRPKHNPQVARRAKLSPHDGAKDRTKTRYVQKLDHVHLPRRHRYIIHPVRMNHRRRRLAVIITQQSINETPIHKIAHNKGYKGNNECYHRSIYKLSKAKLAPFRQL